jgi:hypothetical protein
MANLQETLEGFIKIISSIVPNNLNPKLWIVRNSDVLGASQNFAELQELVDFHPFKMIRGMRATVQNFPTVGRSTDFKLVFDPGLMVDANEESIVTIDNYTTYWQELETTTPSSVRVYEYAPDGSGGGSPIYPYTLAEESNWQPEFDAQKNHRWLRFRDDDVDANADGIFDNWTVPISLNSFQTGDYVENRFQRYALSKPDQDLILLSDLENQRFYVINTGSITIDGAIFESGYRFEYNSSTSVVFGVGAVLRETNLAPSRINSQGQPNNEPAGWEDIPPLGTATLWIITAQKSVYGQLKSPWVIRKIDERPNYVRYSYKSEPNPNTLVDNNTSASDGSQGDTDLINAGWIKTFTDQTFMAYRDDDGVGGFTDWQIEKISGESGEYIDNVFKLYPINSDPDSPSVVAPVSRTPENEGWSDSPLVETATTINFISSARKFFDGTLKTAWSNPVPYTGRSTYQDIISSDLGDEFKINPNTNPPEIAPSLITLTNKIYKGADKIWEQAGVTITFAWERVYNNGAIDSTEAGATSASDFYYLPALGTPGTAGYLFANQRISIKPNAVTGKAVFRCTATLSTAGDPIVFEEEFSIVDISDAIDAKNLSVTADNQILIYDTVSTVFVPSNIELRAYHSNLTNPIYYWYAGTTGAWGLPILSGQDTYTAVASTYFTSTAAAEEARFAVSTHPTDPDLADGVQYFTDTITIGKSSSVGIGSPGENSVLALLDNESHTVVINSITGLPFTGEIADATYPTTGVIGKAVTRVEIWDGSTKLSLGATGQQVNVTISNPTRFGIEFGVQGQAEADRYANVYVKTWVEGEVSTVCTITLVYSGRVFTKQFSISSTQDAPGAIILDIDSDSGFEWTPSQRGNKTLSGNLYDSNVLQTSDYEYRWLLNGNTSLGTRSTYSTGNIQVTLSRTDVGFSADITCQVRAVGETAVLRSRTVKFTDVLDNQKYIAWTDFASTTNANKIANGVNPTTLPETVGSAVWYLSTNAYWETHEPLYACNAEETNSQWVWTYPYKITGEKGDQGPNGDYFFNMYKANGTTIPSSTATITFMYANGWRRIPPATGILYQVTGRFNGEIYPIGTDGYPWHNGATSATNSTATPELGWSTPIRITGIDGTDGTDGTPGTSGSDGNDGWTPVFAVVTDGDRKVQRVTDWTGGSGTKPTTGLYVGVTGFVTDIAIAINIKGDQGDQGESGVAQGIESAQRFAEGVMTHSTSDILTSNYVYTTFGGYIGVSGMVFIYGDQAATYTIKLKQASSQNGSYLTLKSWRFEHDVHPVTTSEPAGYGFHIQSWKSLPYLKFSIRRSGSGGTNTIMGIDAEFKFYN